MGAKILTRTVGTVGLRTAGELAGQLGLAGASAATEMPFVSGHFARFGAWTEISSAWEGRFLERIAPGAFARTIKEDRPHIRLLFQHGQDPLLGARPIASLDGLGEDATGGWYFGKLFPDTIASRELLPLLRAGVLGSSFRFKVDRERVDAKPLRSDRNPERLPERTITEVTLFELGPVVFPAYPTTTAGVSSGEHPPRSTTPPPVKLISSDEFVRRLLGPYRDTPAKRLARERWLNKVLPR